MEKLNHVLERARLMHKNLQPIMVDIGEIESIAEAFRALEQEKKAAEAKLAELEKQEPVGYTYNRGINCEIVVADLNDDCPCGVDLFTRPAPAINLAELVPDNALREIDGVIDWINGLPIPTRSATKWLIKMSDLRAAILRNIEEAK